MVAEALLTQRPEVAVWALPPAVRTGVEQLLAFSWESPGGWPGSSRHRSLMGRLWNTLQTRTRGTARGARRPAAHCQQAEGCSLC